MSNMFKSLCSPWFPLRKRNLTLKSYFQSIGSKQLIDYQEAILVLACWVLLMWAICNLVCSLQSISCTPVKELPRLFTGSCKCAALRLRAISNLILTSWLCLLYIKDGRSQQKAVKSEGPEEWKVLWQCKMLMLLFTTVPQPALPTMWVGCWVAWFETTPPPPPVSN